MIHTLREVGEYHPAPGRSTTWGPVGSTATQAGPKGTESDLQSAAEAVTLHTPTCERRGQERGSRAGAPALGVQNARVCLHPAHLFSRPWQGLSTTCLEGSWRILTCSQC